MLELNAEQLEMLKKYLSRAMNTEFYMPMKHILRSLIDSDVDTMLSIFQKSIPIITKDTIIGNEKSFIPKEAYHRIRLTCCSSGTSRGKPSFTFYTGDELLYFKKLSKRIHNNMLRREFGLGTPALIIVPFFMTAMGAIVFLQLMDVGYNISFVDSGAPVAKLTETIKNVGPLIIKTTPDIIYEIIENEVMDGIEIKNVFGDVEHIQFTGNVIGYARRRQIESILDVETSETFGISELGGPLGGECYHKNGMHFYASEKMIIELDTENKVLDINVIDKPTRGKLIATPLYREGMILLRYFTDDIVEIDPNKCGCGDENIRMKFLGKIQYCFRSNKTGEYFTPRDLEETLLSIDDSIWEFMLYVDRDKEKGRLIIEYLWDPKASINEIKNVLEDILGIKIRVEKVVFGKINRTKPKRNRIVFV